MITTYRLSVVMRPLMLRRVLAKDREAPAFTSEEIAAMVAAEMDYEESLI